MLIVMAPRDAQLPFPRHHSHHLASTEGPWKCGEPRHPSPAPTTHFRKPDYGMKHQTPSRPTSPSQQTPECQARTPQRENKEPGSPCRQHGRTRILLAPFHGRNSPPPSRPLPRPFPPASTAQNPAQHEAFAKEDGNAPRCRALLSAKLCQASKPTASLSLNLGSNITALLAQLIL